jgi:hypothetical protein
VVLVGRVSAAPGHQAATLIVLNATKRSTMAAC